MSACYLDSCFDGVSLPISEANKSTELATSFLEDEIIISVWLSSGFCRAFVGLLFVYSGLKFGFISKLNAYGYTVELRRIDQYGY